MHKELCKEVSSILAEWDPIGIRRWGGDTEDEYQPYVAKLVELVRRGANCDRFYDHLRKLESTSMGLAKPSPRTREAARKLSDLASQS